MSKINLNDTRALRIEFEGRQLGFNSLHDDMQTYLDGYSHNFFYAPRSGMSNTTRNGVNLVQVFADKLWDHVSEMPRISVPASIDNPKGAEMREKYIYSELKANNFEL